MTCGIYRLIFKNTDKTYIGQSYNIENKRYNEHLNSFKNNTASKRLQEAYTLFGTPSLEILCECTEKELNNAEDDAIEIFDSINNGFNTRKVSSGGLCVGEEHGRSKVSNETIINIFNILVDFPEKTLRDISKDIWVPLSIVEHISDLSRHLWLKDTFPEKYNLLEKLKGNRQNANNKGIIYPKIVSPDGLEYIPETLKPFAREHNLDSGALLRLFKGKVKTHKGWKLV